MYWLDFKQENDVIFATLYATLFIQINYLYRWRTVI
ncbi:MAG: hypothetical protein JWQ38_2809 [Flavipsychrobacter sp.]|nr:hypothetical protein [Flavipsychrobacter sp.]